MKITMVHSGLKGFYGTNVNVWGRTDICIAHNKGFYPHGDAVLIRGFICPVMLLYDGEYLSCDVVYHIVGYRFVCGRGYCQNILPRQNISHGRRVINIDFPQELAGPLV